MTERAIIGGTGLTSLAGLEIVRRETVCTPYGEPSGPLIHGVLNGSDVLFLARHGQDHNIPPHKVNYRANIWALKHAGVRKIIAVAAVGGIHRELAAGRLAIPDQIIDYTWARGHTFFETELTHVVHVDFTEPYSPDVRQALIQAASGAKVDVAGHGTYGATQGPRLESAAEIDRLERDGCSMVGMTGMPEAGLARELELAYGHCAVVANPAAGRGESVITMAQIEANLDLGMERVRTLLRHAIPLL